MDGVRQDDLKLLGEFYYSIVHVKNSTALIGQHLSL